RAPVPALLQHRISVDYADRENRPPLPLTSKGHSLDRLEQGVQAHIRQVIQQRDELVARAMPPETLFDPTYADQDAIRLGARLNQTYAAALAVGRKGESSGVLERARRAAEDYLAHFPPD